MLKESLEGALDGELMSHIEEPPNENNRKNDKGRRQVKSFIGTADINPPRGRNSSFEPELILQRYESLSVNLNRQIVSLYSHGATESDIRDRLKEMRKLDASTAAISGVTGYILQLIQE